MNNRLKKVISELLSTNQHAFLGGRQLSDCSLLAHELIIDFKESHGKIDCIKVIFKGLLIVLIGNLSNILMLCQKFPIKWIVWIKECLLLSQMAHQQDLWK